MAYNKKDVTIYECEKCGHWYRDSITVLTCDHKDGPKPYPAPEPEQYKCWDCGVELPRYKGRCDECDEKFTFNKARKVKDSEYKINVVYDHRTDQYYDDTGVMEDAYSYENREMPKWVYGCEPVDFYIDIGGTLENITEDMDENFDYDIDIVDLKELYDFIDKWNAKQTYKSYLPDYSVAVMIGE